MAEGRPYRVSTSSMCSTRRSRHISNSLSTLRQGLGPSLRSRLGVHSAAASASAAAWAAAAILSSRADSAAALPSTSCLALDHGPSVLACHGAHLLL